MEHPTYAVVDIVALTLAAALGLREPRDGPDRHVYCPVGMGGDHMKKMTGARLLSGPTRVIKTKARIARAQLLMDAAREQASEMAQKYEPLTATQRRRLAQLRSL
jgi:hypothetical protein